MRSLYMNQDEAMQMLLVIMLADVHSTAHGLHEVTAAKVVAISHCCESKHSSLSYCDTLLQTLCCKW
jgi:hypothetical protein